MSMAPVNKMTLSSNTSTSMLAAGEGVWECEGETKSHLKAACAVGEGTP